MSVYIYVYKFKVTIATINLPDDTGSSLRRTAVGVYNISRAMLHGIAASDGLLIIIIIIIISSKWRKRR